MNLFNPHTKPDYDQANKVIWTSDLTGHPIPAGTLEDCDLTANWLKAYYAPCFGKGNW